MPEGLNINPSGTFPPAPSNIFSGAVARDMKRFQGFRNTWREVAFSLNNYNPPGAGSNWVAAVEREFSQFSESTELQEINAGLCGAT